MAINLTAASNFTNGVYNATAAGTTFHYAAGTNTGLIVNLAGGANTFNFVAASTAANTYTGSLTVNGGAGADTFTATAATSTVGKLIAYGNGGADTFTDAAKMSGDSLYGGAGNDTFNVYGANDYVNGGADNDTFTVKSKGDTIVGGAGNDLIALDTTGLAGNDLLTFGAGDGSDTVTGFDFATDTAQFGVAASALTYSYDAANSQIVVGDGVTGDQVAFKVTGPTATGASTYSLSSFKDSTNTALSGKIELIKTSGTAQDNAYVMNATAATVTVTYDSKALKIDGGKATAAGNTIAAATTYGAINLSGSNITNFEKITDAKGYNYLRGDSANNTITVSAKGHDNIWGGTGGSDTLDGGSTDGNVFWFGKTDGNDVVENTTATDTVYLYDASASDVSFSKASNNTDLIITLGGSANETLTVQNYFSAASTTGTATAPKIQLSNGQYLTPIVGSPSSANTIPYNATTAAGLIAGVGTQNTVDASTETDLGAVTINLYDTTKFSNIQSIKGSQYNGDYLRGDGQNNTITAVAGGANIWGGNGGNDTLNDGATGSNTFWFGTGDGKDVVVTGAAATDTVKLYNIARNAVTAQVASNGTDIIVGAQGDSTDSLTVKGGSIAAVNYKTSDGQKFNIATVSGTVTAATSVVAGNLAIGTVANAAVTGQTTINLYDTTQFVNINNAKGIGNGYVRGNSAANDLVAGASDQLWGGTGGNDTLDGSGSTKVTFWFGQGDGADTVTNGSNVWGTVAAGTADTINLYNVSASQLSYAIDANNNLDVTIAGDSADNLVIANNTHGIADFGSVVFKDQNGLTYNVLAADSNGDAMDVAPLKANSLVVGGVGDDVISNYEAQAGLGLINGGAGNNTVKAGTTTTTINLYDTTKFTNVQNATGNTGGNDYLRGDANNNVLTAGGAGDQLWGAGGSDTLDGATKTGVTYWFGQNDGNDVIKNATGAGNSVMLYDSGLSASSVGVTMSSTGSLQLAIGNSTLSIANWTATGCVDDFVIGTTHYKVNTVTDSTGKTTYSLTGAK